MSTKGKLSVLLIGGKDAGKSNFLFRLWLRLEQGKGALLCNGLPAELEYLRVGSHDLLKGAYAGRTSREVIEQCVIPVKTTSGDFTGELVIPDCNGEKFDTIYTRREWGAEWDDLISDGSGCLLFVRADSDQVLPAMDWIAYNNLFPSKPASRADTSADEPKTKSANTTESLSQKAVTAAASGSAAPNTGITVPKTQTPTQVVLVEWLQFLRQAYTANVSSAYRPRIGIVVSAWDAVPAAQQEKGPFEYILTNFPLLAQFIKNSERQFDLQVFGVSVSGGDLQSDPDYKKQYLASDPNQAGFVVYMFQGKQTISTDHTLPVAWALGVEALNKK